MTHLAEASSGDLQGRIDAVSTRRRPPLTAVLAVCALYYVGARIGMAFTEPPFPLSVLWPPNALLFAALVLVPTRWWWAFIAAAFPAHLLAELQESVPVVMVLCWFVSIVTEALLGASLVRGFARRSHGLSTVRSVIVFFCAAVLATLLSSFIDAAFVRLVGFGQADYWSLWRARVPSNMLAVLVIVPVAMTWATVRTPLIRNA